MGGAAVPLCSRQFLPCWFSGRSISGLVGSDALSTPKQGDVRACATVLLCTTIASGPIICWQSLVSTTCVFWSGNAIDRDRHPRRWLGHKGKNIFEGLLAPLACAFGYCTLLEIGVACVSASPRAQLWKRGPIGITDQTVVGAYTEQFVWDIFRGAGYINNRRGN